jgi:hypothetical protein
MRKCYVTLFFMQARRNGLERGLTQNIRGWYERASGFDGFQSFAINLGAFLFDLCESVMIALQLRSR